MNGFMSNRFVGFIKSVFSVRLFVRNIYAGTLLENFFVSAVISLLATRLLLLLTGYPTIGGERFHIAHLLFGGLLMLVALLILLSTLNHAAEELGAIIGGAGFGVFIDELGKFITNDNNYFYQPAIALIYLIFVTLYLTIRLINRSQGLSRTEALANAFEIAQQASLSNLDDRDGFTIQRLLEFSDPDDVFTQNLKDMLPRISTIPPRNAHAITRIKRFVDDAYQRKAVRLWFAISITVFFILSYGVTFYSIIALIDWSWLLLVWILIGIVILILLFKQLKKHSIYLEIFVFLGFLSTSLIIAFLVIDNLKTTPTSFSDSALLFSSGISAVLVALGILNLYRSRLGAYNTFRWAILVSILLTRVFSFYKFQLAALTGLTWDLLILIALRFLIRQEEERLGRLNRGNIV
jgi:hypothetical protein